MLDPIFCNAGGSRCNSERVSSLSTKTMKQTNVLLFLKRNLVLVFHSNNGTKKRKVVERCLIHFVCWLIRSLSSYASFEHGVRNAQECAVLQINADVYPIRILLLKRFLKNNNYGFIPLPSPRVHPTN